MYIVTGYLTCFPVAILAQGIFAPGSIDCMMALHATSGEINQLTLALQLNTSARKEQYLNANESTVRSLHRQLFEIADPAQAGELRSRNVRLRGQGHVPPRPDVLPEALNQFCEEVNMLQRRGSPSETFAYCAWRLTHIHPFADGNGRTGRALGYLLYCVGTGQHPLPASQLLHVLHGRCRHVDGRVKYLRALQAADEQFLVYGRSKCSELQHLLEAWGLMGTSGVPDMPAVEQKVRLKYGRCTAVDVLGDLRRVCCASDIHVQSAEEMKTIEAVVNGGGHIKMDTRIRDMPLMQGQRLMRFRGPCSSIFAEEGVVVKGIDDFREELAKSQIDLAVTGSGLDGIDGLYHRQQDRQNDVYMWRQATGLHFICRSENFRVQGSTDKSMNGLYLKQHCSNGAMDALTSSVDDRSYGINKMIWRKASGTGSYVIYQSRRDSQNFKGNGLQWCIGTSLDNVRRSCNVSGAKDPFSPWGSDQIWKDPHGLFHWTSGHGPLDALDESLNDTFDEGMSVEVCREWVISSGLKSSDHVFVNLDGQLHILGTRCASRPTAA